MKRILLSCLILGAFFELAVQGSETNNEHTKDSSKTITSSAVQAETKSVPKKADTAVATDSRPISSTTNAPSSNVTSDAPPNTTSSTPSPKTTSSPTEHSTLSTSTVTSTSTLTSTILLPKTTPSPPEYDWIVRGENSTICILASMTVQLSYTINSNSTIMSVPKNANESGLCGNHSQVLQLMWGDGNTMSFAFARENELYYLSNVDVVSKLASPNITVKFAAKLKTFSTNVKSSYECTWSEPISGPVNDTLGNPIGHLIVTLTDIHVEAFHNSTTDKFSLALVCQTDASDIVPVMVAIALIVLVVVVLILYVIGRRASQASGYTSM